MLGSVPNLGTESPEASENSEAAPTRPLSLCQASLRPESAPASGERSLRIGDALIESMILEAVRNQTD